MKPKANITTCSAPHEATKLWPKEGLTRNAVVGMICSKQYKKVQNSQRKMPSVRFHNAWLSAGMTLIYRCTCGTLILEYLLGGRRMWGVGYKQQGRTANVARDVSSVLARIPDLASAKPCLTNPVVTQAIRACLCLHRCVCLHGRDKDCFMNSIHSLMHLSDCEQY